MALASTATRAFRGAVRRLPTAATPAIRSTIAPVNAMKAVPRRHMGGGGPPIVSQSMEAKLFEGSPENEGWETTVYVTYALSAVIITMALGFAPDTSIETWAEGEARARLTLQAEGKLEQPVFGTHYDTAENKFDFDCISADNPFNEVDDDDEDDEDDEDEEEEVEEDDE